MPEPLPGNLGGVAGPLAGAGQPRRRGEQRPTARRVGSWLIWWVLLMALWTWADDSLLTAELAAGAVVAALGATLVEVAQHQAASHVRIRIEWLTPALGLPVAVVRDSAIVFLALFRKLALGEEPSSGFDEEPVVAGDDSAEGATRRALILAGSSFAPNTFALGIDERRDVMVVHRLVTPERQRAQRRRAPRRSAPRRRATAAGHQGGRGPARG